MILLDVFEDGVPPAYDAYAIDIAIPLIGIVVDDTDDLAVRGIVVHVPQNHLSGSAGTDEHDPVAVLSPASVGEEKNDSVGESDPQYEDTLKHGSDHIIRDRHAAVEKERRGNMDGRHQKRSQERPAEFIEARETPDAFVQAEQHKHDETGESVDERESAPRHQINLVNQGVSKIKADQKSEKI